MSSTTMVRLVGLALLGTLAAGCAGSGSDPLAATPVAMNEVAVVDNDFDPVAVQVAVGTEVTWTWEGSNRHNVVADDGAFESEVQREGTFTHTFEEAGTFAYHCTLHSSMDGVVIVGDAAGTKENHADASTSAVIAVSGPSVTVRPAG